MKCRMISLVLILSITVCMIVPAYADVSGTDMRHSVACVEFGLEGDAGYLPWSSGTCFFVGAEGQSPQFLLTNHHVVDDFITMGSGELVQLSFEDFVYWVTGYTIEQLSSELGESSANSILNIVIGYWEEFAGEYTIETMRAKMRVYYDNNDYEEAYLIDSDSVRDMALLRLAAPTDKRSPIKITLPDEEMVTKTVYTVGYPGVSDNKYFESITQRGETDATVNTGTVSRLLVETGTGVATIQTDAVIAHGNSGGPLVFENGAVIGINSWEVKDTSKMEEVYYALSMAEVIPMLDRNHVDYEIQEWPEVPEKEFPWAWVIVGVAVLVIIGVVLAVVLKKRNKKQREQETSAPPVPAPAPVVNKADPNDSGFRIQGVSGALEGRRFMIRKNAPVILGRNGNECGIVFPENTKGVSGRHCALWIENGNVYLRDLGSSHGTFLEPGTRLAAEQPVQVQEGQRFWLGSELQSFVISRKRA